MEAALDLFARKGYEGTSMRDLARTAGMSTPNVYNYTTSKEDLLWRIMDGTMTRLLAGFTACTDGVPCPVARTAAAVRNHVHYHATHPREAIIGNGQTHFLTDDRRSAVKSFQRQYQNGLRAVIASGIDQRLFAVEDPKLASFAILQMGIAVSTWFRDDGGRPVAEVADVYTAFALRLLTVDRARHDEVCGGGEACLSGRTAAAADTAAPTENGVTQ